MTSSATAFAKLSATGLRAVRTAEAAALLGISAGAAAQLLRRLGQAGLVQPLMQGVVWLGRDPVDPWVALEMVTAPYPAYASLYSALYLRGALSQLPVVHYAVTLGRARRVRTTAGTFSLHRLAPELFGGFETVASGAKIAPVEKALFDLAYLSATRSRLFARPPEIDVPRSLDRAVLRTWLQRIGSPERRTHTERQLEAILERGKRRPTPRRR